MGLLDSILGAVLGGSGNQQNQIAQIAMQLLSGSGSVGTPGAGGGLGALIQQFQKAGLGDAINSWIGTGQNHAVSGDQIHQALGPEQIQQFAQQTGMQGHEISGLLAQMLPQLIDKVTPHGSVPQGNDLQGMLTGLLGQLGNKA